MPRVCVEPLPRPAPTPTLTVRIRPQGRQGCRGSRCGHAADGARLRPRGGSGPVTGLPGRCRPSTVARLPGYLRALQGLEGVVTTSSDELAEAAGVTPGAAAQGPVVPRLVRPARGRVRRGSTCREQIGVVLGLTTQRRVVIVGIGNLGHALASYSVFAERGFAVVGLVDADPAVVGTVGGRARRAAAGGAGRARPDDGRDASASSRRPASSAQAVCDALVDGGRGRASSRSRPGRCGCRSTWTCGPSTWRPSCRSSRSTTAAAPGRATRHDDERPVPRERDTGRRRAPGARSALDGRHVERDGDLVADEDAAGLEGRVPGQAEVLAGDRDGGLEAGTRVAERVDRGAVELGVELDGLRSRRGSSGRRR